MKMIEAEESEVVSTLLEEIAIASRDTAVKALYTQSTEGVSMNMPETKAKTVDSRKKTAAMKRLDEAIAKDGCEHGKLLPSLCLQCNPKKADEKKGEDIPIVLEENHPKSSSKVKTDEEKEEDDNVLINPEYQAIVNLNREGLIRLVLFAEKNPSVVIDVIRPGGLVPDDVLTGTGR
jgi:hypothetical protein